MWSGKALEEGTMNFPLPCCPPGGNEQMPYVLVGDDAFALKPYLMKPYAQQGLDAEKRVYNYMHNRARRILENLFGILANRWRFMHNVMLLHPDVIEVLSCMGVLWKVQLDYLVLRSVVNLLKIVE